MHGFLVVALAALGMTAVCRASFDSAVLAGGPLPEDQDADSDVCVPLKCQHGSPPAQCTRLCALRSWLPVCQEGSRDCLCRGPAGELRSPDEMEPEERPYMLTVFFWDFWSPANASEAADAPGLLRVDAGEARMLWDFRAVLGGLLVLMLALVAYELVVCCRQNAKAKVRMDPFDLYGVDKPDDKKQMPIVI